MSEVNESQNSRKRFIGKAAAKKKKGTQQVTNIEDSNSIVSIGIIKNIPFSLILY